MTIGQSFLFLVVSLLASIAGVICGIGGGVIIKPVLDVFGWASISTLSFMSSCTVCASTLYSVGKSLTSGEKQVDLKVGTPLAIGAALGGVGGKQLFNIVKAMFENQNTVGAVQAACLLVATFGTLIYTLRKSRIATKQMQGAGICLVIGLALGLVSSFMGIGGGPFNLVVLGYFFSMPTKVAAANSLYIILFSQGASIVATFVTNTVPTFEWLPLIFMIIGGVAGGILGRKCSKKMDNAAVDKLFIAMLILIMAISAFNVWQYAGV